MSIFWGQVEFLFCMARILHKIVDVARLAGPGHVAEHGRGRNTRRRLLPNTMRLQSGMEHLFYRFVEAAECRVFIQMGHTRFGRGPIAGSAAHVQGNLQAKQGDQQARATLRQLEACLLSIFCNLAVFAAYHSSHSCYYACHVRLSGLY